MSSAPVSEPKAAPALVPSFGKAARVWARIGLLSFGGPAGQIALMHRELVEERRWIGEQRFLHALNYCMLLPGPEAQQLATLRGRSGNEISPDNSKRSRNSCTPLALFWNRFVPALCLRQTNSALATFNTTLSRVGDS
jgi:hypothetical protein